MTDNQESMIGADPVDKEAAGIVPTSEDTEQFKNMSIKTEPQLALASETATNVMPTLEVPAHLQSPPHIKKEDSHGPMSVKEPSPMPSSQGVPSKGPTKKTGPASNKKATKKRKLDSRADTPQSQRSGTPNSILGGKAGSRIKKQNSTTPLHSSPAPEDNDEDEESDNELYCICRKGDDHTWMIACDGGCDDWFHGRCVGIDQRDGNLIDRFICPNCSDVKGIKTTWKPMCRLDGCREPAAINTLRPSKYCCDDHAAQFFRNLIKKGLGTDTAAPARKRRKEATIENIPQPSEDIDKPAHLRGGLLSPSELKAVTNGLQSCGEFKNLGESPAAVSKSQNQTENMEVDSGTQAFTKHESDLLDATIQKTDRLKNQLKTLENRERFLALVRSRSKTVQEELKKKDKSMKDMCGFDRRLRWSDSDFDGWCDSEDGKEAFRSGKLHAEQMDADGDATMEDSDELGKGLCMRKRCKQHEGWFKLHSQEFAYGKSDVSREMARLAGEERGIRERATVRQLELRNNPA